MDQEIKDEIPENADLEISADEMQGRDDLTVDSDKVTLDAASVQNPNEDVTTENRTNEASAAGLSIENKKNDNESAIVDVPHNDANKSASMDVPQKDANESAIVDVSQNDAKKSASMDVPSNDANKSASLDVPQNDASASMDVPVVVDDKGIASSEDNTVIEDGATNSAALEGAVASGSQSPSSQTPLQSVYHIKWIQFKGDQVAIITQNENGPCPLLAIMNILLLQRKVKFPGMIEMVSSGQLMEYLGDCIFENAPKNINEESRLNYEQNMSDAMAIFHKLQTGLDVNVKFTGVTDFEYTPECIVFDLLNIQLVHGWLVDPQNASEADSVGNCSYNQLVEKIITQKNSTEESQVTEALIAEDFLSKSSHQLTYHGLCMLASQVKEAQLAVLFRNNHFSTILKHRDELLVLVTDQGFLTESNVVWETLSNVEGDCYFVDAEFRTFRRPESSSKKKVPSSPIQPGSPQQVDQDYLVALSLQQENQEAAATAEDASSKESLTDHELAMKLQREEDHQMALQQQKQQQQQRRQQQAAKNQQLLSQQYEQARREERKKNDGCVLL